MQTRQRKTTNKRRKMGGVGTSPFTLKRSSPKPYTSSPLRKSISASSGRGDEFIVENINEYTSLEKCKKQYRLLKFGYEAIERKNAYLLNELEKLKKKE
jgi:hypothetical protein